MSTEWPALPYEAWRATRDTLHAHTQILGKLAAALAPPEPQLQHTALRISARGWETLPWPWRPGRDQPEAAGDAVDDPARRGRRARDLRPRHCRGLLRGRDACCAGPRGAQSALPR